MFEVRSHVGVLGQWSGYLVSGMRCDMMTKKEAWEFLDEHIPEGAGYDPCEWEEMAEYIEQYNEAYRIVRGAVLNDSDV